MTTYVVLKISGRKLQYYVFRRDVGEYRAHNIDGLDRYDHKFSS